jgi:hypothetical protein
MMTDADGCQGEDDENEELTPYPDMINEQSSPQEPITTSEFTFATTSRY